MGQLLPTDSPISSCPHYYLSVLSSPAAEGSRAFPIAEEGRAQTEPILQVHTERVPPTGYWQVGPSRMAQAVFTKMWS